MTTTAILLLLTALTFKHFVLDFVYQPPWQWKNKGTFGHPGGIAHSGQHALGTMMILFMFVPPWTAAAIALVEFIIHYVTDWSKMNINKAKGWAANTHNEFWILMGADQLVHSMTYIAIVAAVAYV